MKPKYQIHIFRTSLAAVLVFGIGQSARAVTTLYWDTSTSSGYQAGNGTWGSSSYWTTNGTTLAGWTSNDIAEFDTTGSPNTNTITMGANITAAGLNFQTGTTTIGSVGDGYKISLGTSYLTGSGSGTGIINTNLVFTTNESSTINTGGSIYVYGVISDSNSYSFSTHDDTGGVTYFYNTANTYRGGTTITGAPLHIAVLGNSSANSSIGTGALTFNFGHAGSGTGNCDLVFDGANATGSTTNRLFTITSTSATQNTNAEIINNGSGAVNFNNTGALTMTGAYIHGLQLGGGYTGADNTFAPVISNPSGSTTSFTKSDAGTWVLTGANTYTGGTTVNGGTLALSGSGTLGGSTGTVKVTNGAILDLGGTTQTVGTVGASGAGNGVVGTIQNGTLNIQQNNMCFQNGTLSADLSGTAGGGSQRLWIGGDASATVLLGGNNTIHYTDHNSTIIGNPYTGAAGTVKLTSATALGPNTETTQVFAGTLDLNGQTNVTCLQILLASGASSSLVNNNTSTASSYGGNVSSTTGAQYGGAGNLTLSGSASSTDLTKIGTGTLTLSGPNTYTGATTISGGTLTVGAANAIPGGTAVTVGGGTLDASAYADTISSLNITSGSLTLGINNDAPKLLSITNAFTLGGTINVAATGTLTQGSYTLATYASESGLFTQGTVPAGYQLVAKPTELDLQQISNNANQAFSGPTPATTFSIITGGTQAVSATLTNTAPSGSVALNVNLADNHGAGGAVGGLSSSTGSTVAVGTPSTVSGTFTAGTATGAGQTWSISNTDNSALNTFVTTGGTVNVYGHAAPSAVTGGTLTLGDIHLGYTNPVASGNSDSVTNGSSGNYIVALAGGGAQSGGTTTGLTLNPIGGGGTITAGQSATIGASLAPGLGAGAISQSFTYTFADDSALSGASANVGTAAITVSGQVYSGQSTWNTNGGGSWGTLASGFGTNWGGNQGSPGLDTNFQATDTATFDNTALVSGNSATVTLDGASPSLAGITFNTQSGSGYTIAPGTGGSITLNNGSNAVTINVVSGTQTISAPVTLASNLMATVTNSGDSLGISGNISESGGSRSLTMTGAGTLTLSGANTYTGATSVSNGTLSVNTVGISTNAQSLGMGGTLNLGVAGISSGTLLYTGTGGTLDKNINALGNGLDSIRNTASGLLTLSGTVTNNGTTVTLGGSGAITVSGTISGSGAGASAGASNLIDADSGLLTLSTADNYDGSTTVDAGSVLEITNGDALGGNGATVLSGGALELSGGIMVGAEALSLSGTGVGNGGALRNVSGTNTYGGTVTLAADSRINSDAASSLTLGDIGGAFNLTIGGAGNTTVSGAISTNTLTKDGSGTLTLSGTNTYTGTTSILAGVLNAGNADATGSGALGNGGNITFGGGTLQYSAASSGTDYSSRIKGSGSAIALDTNGQSVTLAGVIDSSNTAGLTKLGAGTLVLGGPNTFTGPCTVAAGTLQVTGGTAAGSAVEVQSTATLAGAGTLGGSVTVDSGGHLAYALASVPGSQATQTITGALTLSSGNVIDVSAAAAPASGTYVLATAIGGITGTPGTVNLPAGVTGTLSVSGNNLQLAVTTAAGYSSWIAGFPGLSDTTPGGNPSGDGISNLIKYALNGDPTQSDTLVLPTQAEDGNGNLVFTYTRLHESTNDTTQIFEYGSDLVNWSDVTIPASSGASASAQTGGAIPAMSAPSASVTITPNGSTDTVVVTLPTNGATVLFARLKVTQP